MNGAKDPPDLRERVTSDQTMMDDGAGTSVISTDNNRNGQRMDPENIIYTKEDSAPYRLYFELRDNKGGTEKINKFSLGSFLRKMDHIRQFITDMKYVGQHKILVFMSSYSRANLTLKAVNNGDSIYKAYIPKHLVCVTGVLAGVPTDIDIEEIKMDLECNVPIVNVVRLTKRVDNGDRIPINRLSITFRASELPTEVRLFCCLSRVKPFTSKVVICLNCLRFGHLTDNCKGARRCKRCTLRHETREEFQTCQKAVTCAHCHNDHTSTDETCPERKRQQNIKFLMSKKNLTYTEAREQIPLVSENVYELLQHADEFPTTSESFSSMAKGNYAWKDPLREQWIKTNQERKVIEAAVKTYKDQPKNQKSTKPKRPRVDEGTRTAAAATTEQRNAIIGSTENVKQNGAALTNPHSVNDKERWETLLREAQATTSRIYQESMMSFYTDFIGMLGPNDDVKNIFNTSMRKHFNLANSVVLTTDQNENNSQLL